jgi:hypothetical protein
MSRFTAPAHRSAVEAFAPSMATNGSDAKHRHKELFQAACNRLAISRALKVRRCGALSHSSITRCGAVMLTRQPAA